MTNSKSQYAINKAAWHTPPTKAVFHASAVTAICHNQGQNTIVLTASANSMTYHLIRLRLNGHVQDAPARTPMVKSGRDPEVTLITPVTEKDEVLLIQARP